MAKLVSNLSKYAAMAPEAASEALLQTSADIVSVIKQLSPVDTGALRQSYGADPVSSSKVIIGSDKNYSIFQEFGTSVMPAQPHFIPAFVLNVETFKVRLKQALERRMK